MTYTLTPFSSTPGETPNTVKLLIFTTASISVLAALFGPLFIYTFGYYGTYEILSLSLDGIKNLFLWQPLSYMFVHHSPGGIQLFFILHLLFNMLILWFVGSALVAEFESKPFLRMYFLSGLVAGLSSLAFMWLSNSSFHLAGCSPSIFALLVVWAMLYPEMELLLFLTFPVKTKWLVTGLLGLEALLSLSSGNMTSFVAHISGGFAGYSYALLAWNLQSPFVFTHSLDQKISSLGQKFRARQQKEREEMQKVYKNVKVFDFKTGEAIISDEDFMDMMLSKISSFGESSLTWKEKKRLRKISDEKKKNLKN